MQRISAANHRAGSGLELGSALRACRGAFLGIGLITGMINVLYLTGSFFMLEVYDRVIPSRSMPTLVGLGVLAGALYLFQGCLDLIRGRLLVRIGAFIDEAISGRAFDAVVRLPLISRGDGLQPIRDLDQVRSFLSGMGPPALFDLPWMPLYLGICFAFHFWIGITAVIGGMILRVKDGDHVKANDILVRLDDTQTRANLAIVTKAFDELAARQARETAERDGAAEISFPAELLRRRSTDATVANLVDG